MLALDFLSAPWLPRPMSSLPTSCIKKIQTGNIASFNVNLHVLQLAELGECVVPEAFVERSVAVLVRDV